MQHPCQPVPPLRPGRTGELQYIPLSAGRRAEQWAVLEEAAGLTVEEDV
ncbi:hypothetical protein ACFYYN_42960 [Streptomyces sp. NPDC001902]